MSKKIYIGGRKKTVIVIGGGTAGLTIASQLQKFFKVIVIEKNGLNEHPFFIFKIPLLGGLLFKNSKYISKVYFESLGRKIPFFESNLLGGASVINGCVHAFGSKIIWGSILKPFNSNYNEALESFYKLFSLNKNENKKINLVKASQNIIDNAFINSLNNQEIPLGDMNFSDKEICGPILITSGKYFRSSVMSLIKNNLFKIYSGEKVDKLLLDDSGQIIGVKTNLQTINSDYVILSSGVIGTCELLLKSKFETHSEKNNYFKNISIGKGVIDHPNLRVKVLATRKFDSLNELSHSGYKKLLIMFKHFVGKSTLLKSPGATSAAYLDLDHDGIIDTKIQLLQFTESGRLGSDGEKNLFDKQPGFSISITLTNPKSVGAIMIKEGVCNVDPKYLSSKKDIDLLNKSLKYCLKLLRSKPLSDYVLKVLDEDKIENHTDDYIINNIFSGYHLIGGSSEAIDANFEVKNIKKLYICDASVFKAHVASNTHAPVVVLGDIFSKKFISNNFDG